MKNLIDLKLLMSEEQSHKLQELQKTFALACDEAAFFVRRSGSWHRVTLHHLAYKTLRQKFPALGSQMVCNAIYAVSKACKEIFQEPGGQWAIIAKSGRSLPILKFSNTTPVFFDKHTLTLKKNELSLFTLDGRMKIQVHLSKKIEERLRGEKLKELYLLRNNNTFHLRFVFREGSDDGAIQIKLSVKVIPEALVGSLAL
jgi:hypothetical protein